MRAATEEVVAAKEAVDAGLANILAQEKAYADKLAELEGRANDESAGLVSRNKAKNELAQAKGGTYGGEVVSMMELASFSVLQGDVYPFYFSLPVHSSSG